MRKLFALLMAMVFLFSAISPNAFATDHIPGDVNGDGKIDGRDLIRLKQFLSGKDVTIIEENADMNGDTKIDGRDAIRLAQFLSGQGYTMNIEAVPETVKTVLTNNGFSWVTDAEWERTDTIELEAIWYSSDNAVAAALAASAMDILKGPLYYNTVCMTYEGESDGIYRYTLNAGWVEPEREPGQDPEYPSVDADRVIKKAKEKCLAKGYEWNEDLPGHAGYGDIYLPRTYTEEKIISKLMGWMDSYYNDGMYRFCIVYKGIQERYADEPEYLFRLYWA